MDELELRIAALETLWIELLAEAGPAMLDAIEARIREGLSQKGEPGYGGDEWTIRQGALVPIEDARKRHELFLVVKEG